jgi:hypothetical protein
LRIHGWQSVLFLAEEEAVEGELAVLIGGERRGDDEDVDTDVKHFGVVRQGGKANAEGEEDEACEEKAETAEQTKHCPDASDEQEVAEGLGIEIAEVLREETVVVSEFGDGGHFLLVVLHVEGGVGTGAVTEFIDARENEAEADPEAQEEIGQGEVPVVRGGARGVRHGGLKMRLVGFRF